MARQREGNANQGSEDQLSQSGKAHNWKRLWALPGATAKGTRSVIFTMKRKDLPKRFRYTAEALEAIASAQDFGALQSLWARLPKTKTALAAYRARMAELVAADAQRPAFESYF